MWLDEIRFRLTESGGQGWSSLNVELKLGNLSLTNGFHPISLLGKALNDGLYGERGASDGTPNCFTWKLPKPLYIPARELLRPTIYYEPYSGAAAQTVTIIYVCRPIPAGTPPPSVLQVPWATHFKPAYLTTPDAADTTDQSTPAHLYNPHDEELHVQRFIGRLMRRNLGEDDDYMGLASAHVNLTTGLVTSGTLVSAQDSFNNILIRDRTPFAHVFSILDRSWTVNCVLPPKGFYLFTVDRLWNAYPAGDGAITATVGISMVGWREVKLKHGGLHR